MTLVSTLFPLFALIAIGFGMVRLGVIEGAAVRPMGAVVIRLALPALIFLSVARLSLTEAISLRFLAAYALASLGVLMGVYLGARGLLQMDRGVAAVVALGACASNSSFLGFPIALALMGDSNASLLLAHCVIVENTLILPLALALMARAGQAQSGAILAGLARNPLVLAIVAGVAVSAAGLPLPVLAESTLALLARISAPLALLVIGGMLATLPVQGTARALGVIVGAKLLVHPLVMLLAVTLIPGIPPMLINGGILMAAMPMVTIFPLLAAQGGQGQLGALGLLTATLAGFATLPIVITLLGLA
jgi:malonate transporter and related proteins